MKKEQRKTKGIDIDGSSLAIGLSLGTMLGIMFENLTLWMPLGLCIAVVLSVVKKKEKDNNNNTNEPDKK